MTERRSGLTLVELLVVIFIIVTLGAFVVPNLAPTVEQRRVREAARGVNTFLAGAKARAIRNGRPVAVLIARQMGNPNAALNLYYAQVPAPYSGVALDSSVRVAIIPNAPLAMGEVIPAGTVTVSIVPHNGEMFPTGSAMVQPLIRAGDSIQFNNQGYHYQIISSPLPSTTRLIARLSSNASPGNLPWPVSMSATPAAADHSQPVSFKVFRRPVYYAMGMNTTGIASGSSDVYQLPAGTVVDLYGSVFPGVPIPANDIQGIAILFSATGSATHVFYGQGEAAIPSGPINLLIGKTDNVVLPATTVPATDNTRNWYDLGNLWVTITPSTGQVTTADMARIDATSFNMMTPIGAALLQATAYTRTSQTLSGN